MSKKSGYGMITEQGDLGLGFTGISNEEKAIIESNEKLKNSGNAGGCNGDSCPINSSEPKHNS